MSVTRVSRSTLGPALLGGSALLTAFYGSVWQLVYTVGIPTGLASTFTQLIVLAPLVTAAVVCRNIIQRRHVALFFLLSLGSGFGGAFGSILGNSLGTAGLITGALLGGLAATYGVVRLAVRWRWVPESRALRTAVAAGVGFLVASVVAIATISTPVGPIISTTLVGAAGLWGSWEHKY